MDPSDITGIARELYRLKDAETVLFGMDLPTLIQAALAVIAGWYALVTHAMLRQNRKKMRADEAERRILQKQYLNSIAPVLRTASFTGNEEELTLDVENLKTNCPAFGACAVAYLPGLGFYADPFHAAIDRSFRFTLHRGGAEARALEIAAQYGQLSFLNEKVETIKTQGESRGLVFLVYRDTEQNAYRMEFGAWERDGVVSYITGSEMQGMCDPRTALETLELPA